MSSRALVVGVLAILVAGCGDVSTPRDVECGADVLPNGNFDSPTPPWVQEPVTPSLLCGAPTITPDTAPTTGCLGNVDGTTRTLTQIVPLPEGASTVTLAGRICITTAETGTVEKDTLQFDLLDGAAVIGAIGKRSNLQGVAACDFAPLELTAAVTGDPETATFRIRSTLDANMPTTFFVDTLRLTVGCTK